MSKFNISTAGLLAWSVCALFFLYEFLLRTVLGTFQHPITFDLNLTPLSFAFLSTTSYLIIYGIMQVPAGLIADRFGLKKSVGIALIICLFSAILFSASYQYHTAVLSRMLMGLGSAFGFVCLLVAVYDWLPKQHFGFFIGLSQFIGTLGPMIAAGPLDSLASNNATSWRTVFFYLSIFGVALFFLVIAFVQNNTKSIHKFRIIHKPIPMLQNLLSLFLQKQVWLISLYSALVYFTLEYLSENEGKSYIILNGYSTSFASYMISVGWLGYALGCPMLGFISDYIKRRKSLLVFSALICLISFSIIVYYPVSKSVLTLAFFLLGVGVSGQGIGFAIMAEQCSKSYLAAGLGLNNAMICLVSSANAPIIGAILHSRSIENTLTVTDYQFAFSFIICVIAVSVVLSIFFIKETFCRPTKGFTIINK